MVPTGKSVLGIPNWPVIALRYYTITDISQSIRRDCAREIVLISSSRLVFFLVCFAVGSGILLFPLSSRKRGSRGPPTGSRADGNFCMWEPHRVSTLEPEQAGCIPFYVELWHSPNFPLNYL